MLDQQDTDVVYAYIDNGPSGGLYEVYLNANVYEGGPVEPIVVPPPTNLTVTTVSGKATISWNSPSDMAHVTGFFVARDGTDTTGDGPWSTTIASTQTSFTFTKLIDGTSYTFSVSSVGSDGSRSDTLSITATPGVTPAIRQSFSGAIVATSTPIRYVFGVPTRKRNS